MVKEVADIKTSDQLHLPVPDAKFERQRVPIYKGGPVSRETIFFLHTLEDLKGAIPFPPAGNPERAGKHPHPISVRLLFLPFSFWLQTGHIPAAVSYTHLKWERLTAKQRKQQSLPEEMEMPQRKCHVVVNSTIEALVSALRP